MNSDFLRGAWLIAWHDLRLNLRQKETVLWVFLMPALFFWFIGTVTGSFGASSRPTVALRAGADAGFVADEIAARLNAGGIRVDRLDGAANEVVDRYRRRLEVPADLTRRVLDGEPVGVRLTNPATPGALATALVQGVDGVLTCEIRNTAWAPGEPAKGTCDNGASFGLPGGALAE